MNSDQTMQWGITGCARIAATAMIPGMKSPAKGDVLVVANVNEALKHTRFIQQVIDSTP